MDGYTEQIDVYDFRPALVATGIWVAVGLALDAYLLVTRKDRLITDVLRTKPGRAAMIVLGLHVANCLGRADPFSACASAINRRLPARVVVLTDPLPGK